MSKSGSAICDFYLTILPQSSSPPNFSRSSPTGGMAKITGDTAFPPLYLVAPALSWPISALRKFVYRMRQTNIDNVLSQHQFDYILSTRDGWRSWCLGSGHGMSSHLSMFVQTNISIGSSCFCHHISGSSIIWRGRSCWLEHGSPSIVLLPDRLDGSVVYPVCYFLQEAKLSGRGAWGDQTKDCGKRNGCGDIKYYSI